MNKQIEDMITKIKAVLNIRPENIQGFYPVSENGFCLLFKFRDEFAGKNRVYSIVIKHIEEMT